MIFDITSDIKYIGTDDADLQLFESQYVVPQGMAYNSYVILDEKVAVVDTVDRRCAAEWYDNLAQTLGSRQPDYLIVHHLEPDHASLIADVMNAYPGVCVVCTDKAQKMLPNFFEGISLDGRVLAVKDGDTLSLGRHTLTFVCAPMVHWPEVMVSYDSADKVLFSADAFGKFGTLEGDDIDDWTCEARRYYFNICGKYGPQVQRLLAKAAQLDIRTICSTHGPVLTENLEKYISLYDKWSRYEPESDGVLVAYASIHGNTRRIAEYVAERLEAHGAVEVSLFDLSRCDIAEAVEDAFRLGRCVLACSSYDGDMFPPMHDFLHHLHLKAWQKRCVALVENGSWAPTAGRAMHKMLEQMKSIDIVEPMVTVWSSLKEEDKEPLDQLAKAVLE